MFLNICTLVIIVHIFGIIVQKQTMDAIEEIAVGEPIPKTLMTHLGLALAAQAPIHVLIWLSAFVIRVEAKKK